MAFGLTNSNESGKAGKNFRHAAAPAASRTMKSIAAFVGGVLLFAFSGVAQVATVYAHSGPTPPSSEDLARLEKYPNAASLRILQGPNNTTGLHELAESGALGMLDPEIVKNLRPADLGIADASGRKVIDQFIINPSASFANKEIKALVRAYSETLGAEAQLKLASAAVDNKILDMVALNELSSEDLVTTLVTHVPTDMQGGAREVRSNLLLDALRNRQGSPQLQALVDGMTPAQMQVAAHVVDEYGGTVAHYWAQEGNVKALVAWKDVIDWSKPDVTKATPLGILLTRSPKAFASVFSAGDRKLAEAIANPANRAAVESLVLSHKILEQPIDTVRAVVTPQFLLGPSISGQGSVASKLKAECLVAYLAPAVTNGWTPDQITSVWAEANPASRHNPEARETYYSALIAAKTAPVPETPVSALN